MKQKVKEIVDLIYDKTGISVPVEVIRYGGKRYKNKFEKNVTGFYNKLNDGPLAGEFIFNDYLMDEIMEKARPSAVDIINIFFMDTKIKVYDPERDERVQKIKRYRKKCIIIGFGFYLHDIHHSLNIEVPVKEAEIQPYRKNPLEFAEAFSEYILGDIRKSTKTYKCMDAIIKSMSALQKKEAAK